MEVGLEVTISRSKFLASIFWRKPLNQQIICVAMKVLKGCCFPLVFLKPFYSGNVIQVMSLVFTTSNVCIVLSSLQNTGTVYISDLAGSPFHTGIICIIILQLQRWKSRMV